MPTDARGDSWPSSRRRHGAPRHLAWAPSYPHERRRGESRPRGTYRARARGGSRAWTRPTPDDDAEGSDGRSHLATRGVVAWERRDGGAIRRSQTTSGLKTRLAYVASARFAICTHNLHESDFRIRVSIACFLQSAAGSARNHSARKRVAVASESGTSPRHSQTRGGGVPDHRRRIALWCRRRRALGGSTAPRRTRRPARRRARRRGGTAEELTNAFPRREIPVGGCPAGARWSPSMGTCVAAGGSGTIGTNAGSHDMPLPTLVTLLLAVASRGPSSSCWRGPRFSRSARSRGGRARRPPRRTRTKPSPRLRSRRWIRSRGSWKASSSSSTPPWAREARVARHARGKRAATTAATTTRRRLRACVSGLRWAFASQISPLRRDGTVPAPA